MEMNITKNTIEVKCEYCRALQICKSVDSAEDGRCAWPEKTKTSEGETVLTFDESDPRRMPWHTEAECVHCGRLLDCAVCGDKGFTEVPMAAFDSGQEVLARLAERVEILAKSEERKRDTAMSPILRLKDADPSHSLSGLTQWATVAHVANERAQAFRFVLDDLKAAMGVEQ